VRNLKNIFWKQPKKILNQVKLKIKLYLQGPDKVRCFNFVKAIKATRKLHPDFDNLKTGFHKIITDAVIQHKILNCLINNW
jgi:hypothetical protein